MFVLLALFLSLHLYRAFSDTLILRFPNITGLSAESEAAVIALTWGLTSTDLQADWNALERGSVQIRRLDEDLFAFLAEPGRTSSRCRRFLDAASYANSTIEHSLIGAFRRLLETSCAAGRLG